MHAAEDRREVGEPGIEAEDLRGERLYVERAEQAFQRALHGVIADHGFDMPGQQQVFHHVENEQRRHAEIGEALPHLGREQDRKALADGRTDACAGGLGDACVGHFVHA